MENRTNKIIKFSDNEKYFVLKQAIYKETNYFMTAKVAPDGEDFTGELYVLQEQKKDDKLYFSKVNDTKLLGVLLKYLDAPEEA